jgi:ActR/RegA family two-component response regulator
MTSVLVVEDDVLFGRALARDLTEYGLEVLLATSVDDALDALRGRSIDILLTDLRLGSSDGIDLLEKIRDVSSRTRAVLMSGFASARDYQRAVELGAVRVLCKPFTRAELIQTVRQAIDCETGFRGSIHGLSLVDVLQMFNYGRRSVCIHVGGTSPGRLFLREGQLVHAEHRGRVGEAAVVSILAMPAGSLATAALPDSAEHSIIRDFREVLLDALRALDESNDEAIVEDDFALDAALSEPTMVCVSPPGQDAADVLARVRAIDGYMAACIVLSDNGGVLAHDGVIDLRPAASNTAALVRSFMKTIRASVVEDEAEDVLITATTQVHLLRCLQTDAPAFVHLVLDRRLASPAMAKLALAGAVGALDL